LCGALGERPPGDSAPDGVWTWITPARTEIRTWEVKTGEESGKVTRRDIDQILGQLQAQKARTPRVTVFGCLFTPHEEVDELAEAAARDSIAILQAEAILRLYDLLADRFRTYLQHRGRGTAQERGAARERVELRLPPPGWLQRVLSPSQGKTRTADDVSAEFR
jgi:hypothetical protein